MRELEGVGQCRGEGGGIRLDLRRLEHLEKRPALCLGDLVFALCACEHVGNFQSPGHRYRRGDSSGAQCLEHGKGVRRLASVGIPQQPGQRHRGIEDKRHSLPSWIKALISIFARTGFSFLNARNLSMAAAGSFTTRGYRGVKSAMALPRLVMVNRLPAWT